MHKLGLIKGRLQNVKEVQHTMNKFLLDQSWNQGNDYGFRAWKNKESEPEQPDSSLQVAIICVYSWSPEYLREIGTLEVRPGLYFETKNAKGRFLGCRACSKIEKARESCVFG